MIVLVLQDCDRHRAQQFCISRLPCNRIKFLIFSCAHPQALAKEVFKYAKSTSQLELFPVALLLSLSRVQRFEDVVFDLLKGRLHAVLISQKKIVNTFRDAIDAGESLWLERHSPAQQDPTELFEVPGLPNC